jgi:hypothetical protein
MLIRILWYGHALDLFSFSSFTLIIALFVYVIMVLFSTVNLRICIFNFVRLLVHTRMSISQTRSCFQHAFMLLNTNRLFTPNVQITLRNISLEFIRSLYFIKLQVLHNFV